MPPPLDLTGRTFGRLTVAGRAGRVKFGRWQTAWLCRCACGAELSVPQDRLPHRPSIPATHVVDACPVCRGGPCVVCGATVPLSGAGHGRAATCSPACADRHRKARQRASWRRRVAADPSLPARMHARRLERAAADPDYAARMADWERRRWERHRGRMAADPDYADRVRRRAREAYARCAAEIQAARRARLDAMTPAELQEWCDRARRYCRSWWRRHRDRLKADPAAYARYRQLANEYARRRRALLAGPPPEWRCVVCGAAFASRTFRAICDDPDCRAARRRDVAARSRGRLAAAEFLRIERELLGVLDERGRGGACPDRL